MKTLQKGVVPMLETSNLQESIEYYKTVLGFDCEGVWPENDQPCWASMRRDEAVIMLCSRTPRSKQP